MSKSEGSYIALDDSPYEMFGKTMALPDEVIVQMFTDCTHVSLSEIGEIQKVLQSGTNPRDIKMQLAREIVTLYRGETAAKKAEENFVSTFREGGVSEEAVEVKVAKGTALHVAVKDIVGSKTQLRRLVADGAVSEVGGEKITDFNFTVDKDITVKIGKRRFVKIKVQK